MRLAIFGCLLLIGTVIGQEASTWGTTPTVPTSATVTMPTEATTPTVTMPTEPTTPTVTTPTVGTDGTTVSIWSDSTTVPTTIWSTLPTDPTTVWSTIIPETTTVVPTSTTVPTTTPPERCLPGCIFHQDSINLSTMKFFPTNCITVCTNRTLIIGKECDLTEKQMNETLKNMRHLIGGLLIQESKFKSARFLANLETLECRNPNAFTVNKNENLTELGMRNLTQVSCSISITNNYNMTRLNVPNLIPMLPSYSSNYTMTLEVSYNAPTICFTLQEVSNFMTYDYIKFSLLTGNFCPITSATTSSEKKTCDLQNYTFSNMSTDCVNVYGDVIIDEDNEEHVGNLASVENIFGSLFIYGTNLSSIDFLGNLKRIISLTENQEAMTVEQNSWLTNVSFPSLERVHARALNPIRFDNNSLELIKDPSFCYDIRNSVTDSGTWLVKFDDKICEDVEKAAAALVVKDKSSRGAVFNPVLIFMALIIALF